MVIYIKAVYYVHCIDMVIVKYDQFLLDYLCFLERTFCVNTLHSSEILLYNSVVGRHFCVCTIFITHIIFDLTLDVFLYSVVYVFILYLI